MRAFPLSDPTLGDADQTGGRYVQGEDVPWRGAYRGSSQRYVAPRMKQVSGFALRGYVGGGWVRSGWDSWTGRPEWCT